MTLQRDAEAPRAARQRPQGVHRQRLARAAHADLLARRLRRAARGRGPRSGEPRAEFVRTMRGQIDRLTKLTADLLDLSKLDADAIAIRRRAGRPGRAARAASPPSSGPRSRSTSGSLQVERAARGACRRRPGQGHADHAYPDRQRAHAHAGGNCDHGSAQHSRTDRPASSSPTTALESSPRSRERVFERFYTADDVSGSGLGLAIARELALRMGGDLELEIAPRPHRVRRSACRPGAARGTPREPARRSRRRSPARHRRRLRRRAPAGARRLHRGRPPTTATTTASHDGRGLAARLRRGDGRQSRSRRQLRPPGDLRDGGARRGHDHLDLRRRRPGELFGGGGGAGPGLGLRHLRRRRDRHQRPRRHRRRAGERSGTGPINEASEVYVEFADRNQVAAEIVGFDPYADVALLKVDPEGLDLQPIALGRLRRRRGRRAGRRDRQPVRPGAVAFDRRSSRRPTARSSRSPSSRSTARSRPTPRSTPATPAARCSTPTAR